MVQKLCTLYNVLEELQLTDDPSSKTYVGDITDEDSAEGNAIDFNVNNVLFEQRMPPRNIYIAKGVSHIE